jgi:hypothetical protein
MNRASKTCPSSHNGLAYVGGADDYLRALPCSADRRGDVAPAHDAVGELGELLLRGGLHAAVQTQGFIISRILHCTNLPSQDTAARRCGELCGAQGAPLSGCIYAPFGLLPAGGENAVCDISPLELGWKTSDSDHPVDGVYRHLRPLDHQSLGFVPEIMHQRS